MLITEKQLGQKKGFHTITWKLKINNKNFETSNMHSIFVSSQVDSSTLNIKNSVFWISEFLQHTTSRWPRESCHESFEKAYLSCDFSGKKGLRISELFIWKLTISRRSMSIPNVKLFPERFISVPSVTYWCCFYHVAIFNSVVWNILQSSCRWNMKGLAIGCRFQIGISQFTISFNYDIH